MYDILGGAGGVGASCAERGLDAKIYDTSIDATLDVARREFIQHFVKQCKSGHVACVMLATPCSSFSIAVSRSGRAIRTQEWPLGLPKLATLAEEEKVKQGNETMRTTLKILNVCNGFCTPAIVENPAPHTYGMFPP